MIKPVNVVAGKALSGRSYTDAAHRVFTSPRRVRFKEQEYAIPAESLATALAELRALIARRDWRISFPVEVRVTPADDLWLSTAYGRDSAYIAFHVYHASPHENYFRETEAVLTAAGGRPHWARCTPGTPATCAARIRGSVTSLHCATSSTRSAGSATPTSPRSSARSRQPHGRRCARARSRVGHVRDQGWPASWLSAAAR